MDLFRNQSSQRPRAEDEDDEGGDAERCLVFFLRIRFFFCVGNVFACIDGIYLPTVLLLLCVYVCPHLSSFLYCALIYLSWMSEVMLLLLLLLLHSMVHRQHSEGNHIRGIQ